MGGSSSILDKIPGKRVELVIPGIHLPFDDMDDRLRMVFDTRIRTEVEVISATLKVGSDALEGKRKTDSTSMDEFVATFTKFVKNKHLLPPNYKFFGTGNDKENLRHFLRANTFFTSALGIRVEDNGNVQYTIKSLDNDRPTWYSRAVLGYKSDYPRVNVVLNGELELQSYSVFVSGEDKTTEFSEEDAVAHLAVTLLFFAEILHSILHIFNLIMISTLAIATEHDQFQADWIAPYCMNIYIKYLEVEAFLLNEDGALTKANFNSDFPSLLKISKEIIVDWLKYNSADKFIRGFLLSGVSSTATDEGVAQREIQRLLDPANSLILAEWRKHAALAAPFAADLTAVFERRKPGSVHKTNENLVKYFSKLGEGVHCEVASFQSWVEIMSVFGLVHGNTLSMSRWMLTRTVLAKISPELETFTDRDVRGLQLVTGTISGLENGHRVFSSELLGRDDPYPLLRHVMLKYDAAASELKAAFLGSLNSDPEFFAQFGWIYTDYVLDGIDNKQMTLTTYV